MAGNRTRKTAANGRLDEAMVLLINNQALFMAQLASANERFAERFAESDLRFARVERELAEIRSILREHQRILEALPEAIRDKIGFVRP